MFEGLLQPMHLMVIVGVRLLFFGPKKLAARGKDLAEGLRGIRDSLNSDDTPPKAPPAAQ